MQSPSASYSLTVRLEITNRPGMLGQVTSAIGKAGGDIGAIDLVQVGKSTITRDLTFKARDERHGQQIVERIRGVRSVKVVNVSDRTFLMHLGGKIEVRGKMSVKTRDDLADLAVDELSEMTGLEAEKAKKLIMAARAHWFAGDQGKEAA